MTTGYWMAEFTPLFSISFTFSEIILFSNCEILYGRLVIGRELPVSMLCWMPNALPSSSEGRRRRCWSSSSRTLSFSAGDRLGPVFTHGPNIHTIHIISKALSCSWIHSLRPRQLTPSSPLIFPFFQAIFSCDWSVKYLIICNSVYR
jgi:hypothetical protein